jgi:Flp pilus assembly protein TadG
MHEPYDEPENDAPVGRLRGDRGVAAVEFAFIVPLLALFIFGIISFGLILSFKQDVTRAAAEGSRAGAVASPAVGTTAQADPSAPTNAYTRALEETMRAVEGFDRTCGVEIACNVNLHDCATPVPSGTGSTPSSRGSCITVELIYDYAGYPLIAELPIMSGFLPNELRASSVSRLND